MNTVTFACCAGRRYTNCTGLGLTAPPPSTYTLTYASLTSVRPPTFVLSGTRVWLPRATLTTLLSMTVPSSSTYITVTSPDTGATATSL